MQTGMINFLFFVLRPNENLKKCVCISGATTCAEKLIPNSWR